MLTDDEIEQKSSHGPVIIHQQVTRPTDGASGGDNNIRRVLPKVSPLSFVSFCLVMIFEEQAGCYKLRETQGH